PDVIARFAASCRARGMTINVTRFDGGFGALSQFADLPIDMIKLDRKLVDRIAISRTAQAVARGTVLVAKSLGWRVIAQGVEGSAQRELLTTLGCDGLQGFWLAYPMTAHDFTSWLSIRSAAATAV
ncbi:MAG: EAL domain-containing protein, partial [Vulcanimicrobiaceae bacterium]